MNTYYENRYSEIGLNQRTDRLSADYETQSGATLRSKAGRKRLQRFIDRLQDMLDYYEERYGE